MGSLVKSADEKFEGKHWVEVASIPPSTHDMNATDYNEAKQEVKRRLQLRSFAVTGVYNCMADCLEPKLSSGSYTANWVS